MAQRATNVTPISDASSAGNQNASTHINFSTPAGWAMFYFFAAVIILSILFFTA